MNRNMDSRLAKLEARRRVPEHPRPVHSLIVESEAEEREKIATLIASGAAQDSGKRPAGKRAKVVWMGRLLREEPIPE